MDRAIKPNVFHRAFHRILMLRPVTAILIRILHHADHLTWKINGGRFSLTGLLAGVPTLKVTTIGAKSGLPRSVPLACLPDDEKIGLIASNFGQTHHPAWYHNLKSKPDCQVEIDGIQKPYIAHEAQGEEYERFWNLAVSYYAGYTLYKIRAGKRHIPVMVLEPKKVLPDS